MWDLHTPPQPAVKLILNSPLTPTISSTCQHWREITYNFLHRFSANEIFSTFPMVFPAKLFCMSFFFFYQVENICLHITAGEILCKGPTQATLLLAEDCIQCSDWFPINVY